MSLRETLSGTTIGDRILFTLLLLVSLLGIVFIREVLPKSTGVTIEAEGKVTHRYSLDTDRRVEVVSSHGRLTVEIKGGKVRVTEASCPNKICELQGWISRGVILCLPSRISVTVGGPEAPEDKTVDAVSG